jgi:hypothetical protein
MSKMKVMKGDKTLSIVTGQKTVLDSLIVRLTALTSKDVGKMSFLTIDNNNISLTVSTSAITITYTGPSSPELEKLIDKF